MREGRPNPVSECRVLRLFQFRPVRKGFDAVLRDELIPDMVAFPDLVDVYVGRQGPDEMGDRLVASVWASRAAMSSAVGEGFAPATFHPEHLEETTERILEAHDLDVVLRFDPGDVASPPAAGILRLVRGQVRPGELATYRDQARLGTIADSEARPWAARAVSRARGARQVRDPVGLVIVVGPRGRDRWRRRAPDRHPARGTAPRMGGRPLRDPAEHGPPEVAGGHLGPSPGGVAPRPPSSRLFDQREQGVVMRSGCR